MRKAMYAVLGAALVVGGSLVGTTGVEADGSPQSYVVVLERGTPDVPTVAAGLAQAHGGQVGFVYQHALAGFSITMSPRAASALARNPRVAYVEQDMVRAIEGQATPTGIPRIFADTNASLDIDATDDYRVDVDVAVIDTGVDWEHPDLNVVAGINCASGSPFRASCGGDGDDDHYHGTHVAGTIGAIDNGIGVVGVAPGARLHAVKVLNSNGSGYTSWIVAGIDWVAARAGTIEVANMSLGGSGFNQAEYDAIQGAVDKGVAFAVAAGNSDDDASKYSPAAFDNVLTVSALADFDGAAGGNGKATCRTDQDDTLADFSNWGPAVQLTAPGVCILSTYPIEQGEYGTISGTSMASPHAAGALALLASSNNPTDATDVDSLYGEILDAGNFDWTDDSGDGTKEPLLDVTGFSANLVSTGGGGGGDTTNASPAVSITSPADGSSFDSGSSIAFAGSATDSEDGDLTGQLVWTSDQDGQIGSGGSLSAVLSDGTHVVSATVTDSGGSTGSAAITVTVTSSTSGGALSGSSANNGSTWTARATLAGSPGGSTFGTWDYGGTAGGCTIATGASSCSFSLSGIPKKVSSVTYTDGSDVNLAVTITKP